MFASRTETQGLVLLEAMAQGAPVVSTAELGTRSILVPGSGALVVPEERAAFAAAVVRVLQRCRPARRARRSAGAPTRAPGRRPRWRGASRSSTAPLARAPRSGVRGRLATPVKSRAAPRSSSLRDSSCAVAVLGYTFRDCLTASVVERRMGAKRALIVDDSKSARLFLARVLEKYDIDVDSAESAEAAIDYLNSNRPDVIFMDHLMPGMDGLQAVQAIKNDPRTATIPIMMYTSQEGELYLGQARALGAVGVLPKQIKPTDVSKVLYQLHLVADRRSPEQSSFTPLNVTRRCRRARAGRATAVQARSPRVRCASTSPSCAARWWPAIDTQTERITAEVRALLLDRCRAAAAAASRRSRSPSWAWIVACVALGDRPGQQHLVVAQRAASRGAAGADDAAPRGQACRRRCFRRRRRARSPSAARREPRRAPRKAPRSELRRAPRRASLPWRHPRQRAMPGRSCCRYPTAPMRSVAHGSR